VTGPRPRWNGEPCTAIRGTATVRDSGFFPQPWFRDLEGQTRRVVHVTWQGQTHWLDDADGTGWVKVTTGRGGPRAGHRSIDIDPDTFRADPLPGVGHTQPVDGYPNGEQVTGA
jgi:hypothetical protein